MLEWRVVTALHSLTYKVNGEIFGEPTKLYCMTLYCIDQTVTKNIDIVYMYIYAVIEIVFLSLTIRILLNNQINNGTDTTIK